MDKQMKKTKPLDKDLLYRWFHLHCFIHIYRILTSKDTKSQFAYPRFELFKQIDLNSLNKFTFIGKNSLFKNILFTYYRQILVGAFITIFFACLNLLIPQMIRIFMAFMHDHHVDKHEITYTQILLEGFVLLQFLRIIFGEHSKRLFFELAIKIQSSLAIMLVKKSLNISHEVRKRISQSQILHLQNVDLKLVFTMFQNMYLAIQAPFTILVAIYLLYLQNYKYGLIGIYWFIIAFLLQRQLDSKLKHCNETKLGLIEARSKINYEILGKIRAAKLLGHQMLLVQKNNDYFIQENHDHKMFYEYVTLYDITLILLPILVIVTIAFYDLNQPNQISVSQVYVLLSLLGICFNPMKSFRTLSINFHDGLRSLRRIEQFLNLENQSKNQNLLLKYTERTLSQSQKSVQQRNARLNQHRNLSNKNKKPLITIEKHILLERESENVRLKLHIDLPEDLELHKNQRLVVIGKVGSGVQSFVQALVGSKKITQGQIILNDRISFLGQQNFFRNTTVRENIRFFNQDITDQTIEQVYKLLKLDEDLKLTQGLDGNIDDQYKYSTVQLHKISLARVFCSNADIYLLDRVFQPLNSQDQILVNEILRNKQSQGKLIILTNNTNNFFQKNDRILMVDKGIATNCKTYHELSESQDAQFSKFYQVKNDNQQIETSKKTSILVKFQKKVSLLSRINSFTDKGPTEQEKLKTFEQIVKPTFVYAMRLNEKYNQKQHLKIANKSIGFYIWKFIRAVKFRQFMYIFFIIAVAELMHIFIHFYIGHLEEEHGGNNYSKFKNMIIVQTLLTVGLSGIIYLEGEVASHIAIIQGNNLYKNALTSLTQNKLSCFLKEYSVKLANRFNHDFQQVFIALHMFLNIYKNIVILIATIYFLSDSKQSLILMTLGIAVTYFTVYYILRAVERKVVNHYQEYKYHYVKVLQQSIGGAELISLYGASKQVQKNAKKAYLQSASYKIAESYTSYGVQIFCDLVSLIIFAVVLSYGLKSKANGNSKSIALIATMIHLLIGVFDVLKSIVKDAINFQTFFKINLLPFVQVIKDKTPQTIQVQELIGQSILQYQESSRSLRSSKSLNNSSINLASDPKQEFNQFGNIMGNLTNSAQIKCPQPMSKLKSRTSIKCSAGDDFLKQHTYDIHFNNVILHESRYHEPAFQVYPLNLRIQPGQKVLFCQSNDNLKNYLVYGLTKNLPMFFNPQIMGKERTKNQIKAKDKTILIGGRDICCIQKSQLQQIVQVIIDHDFYIQGTLQENIAWRNPKYDPRIVLKLADFLQLKQELPQLTKLGLKARIDDPSKQLIRKITFLRILSLQPKIIIIKDTESIIGKYQIVDQIRKKLGAVTIIKISSNIAQAFDIDRVILTKNLKIVQDRVKDEALKMPFSQLGKELRNANIQGHIYANQMTSTLANIRYSNFL